MMIIYIYMGKKDTNIITFFYEKTMKYNSLKDIYIYIYIYIQKTDFF